MSPLLRLIGRGALAGAIGGALAVLPSLLLGEPFVNQAIAIEEAAAAAEPAAAEVFSRGTQLFGLIVVSVLIGVAIGILYGVVYALVHRADPEAEPWARALQLAVAGFVGVSLIPFLRYPANPPAVGDPGTVDVRTRLYLAAILIGLATVAAAWQVHRRLVDRGVSVPVRQLAVVLVVLLGLGATFLLPGDGGEITVPAELIWGFRMASLATVATMWFGLGAAFGLIGERAATRARNREAQRPLRVPEQTTK
jgi:predicted cobalt transporter CbtA